MTLTVDLTPRQQRQLLAVADALKVPFHQVGVEAIVSFLKAHGHGTRGREKTMKKRARIRGRLVTMALGLLLSVLPADAQQARLLAWDHPTSEIQAQIVTRFEVRYDGGAWVDVGMTPHPRGAQTPPEKESFAAPVPALVPGTHTADVRACNSTMCGDASSVLSFVFDVKPGTPSGVRFPG